MLSRLCICMYGTCKKTQSETRTGANQPVVELVRWTVVSLIHQGSNPGARIISGFISGFSAMRFQWEETFPSTMICRLSLSKVLIGVGCACVHRDECMRVYMSACVCTDA